jgi:hypothetical protein
MIRYGWIHLLSAIVKEDSVSRQSSIDLFRYGWIHLLPAIVKEDSVSQSTNLVQVSVEFTYKFILIIYFYSLSK